MLPARNPTEVVQLVCFIDPLKINVFKFGRRMILHAETPILLCHSDIWHKAQRVAKFGVPTMSSPGIDRNYEHTNRRKAAQNLKYDDRHDVAVRFGDFIVIPSNHWPPDSHGLQPSIGLLLPCPVAGQRAM